MLDPYFAAEGIVPKDGTGIEPGSSTPRSEWLPLGQVVSCLASRGPRARGAPSQGVMGGCPLGDRAEHHQVYVRTLESPSESEASAEIIPKSFMFIAQKRKLERKGQAEAGRLQ